jgi:hypothetical protein
MSIGATGHKPMTEPPGPVEQSSSGKKRFRRAQAFIWKNRGGISRMCEKCGKQRERKLIGLLRNGEHKLPL